MVASHWEFFEWVYMRALADEGAVFENGPSAVAPDFPPIEIFAVEQGVPVFGGEECSENEEEGG